MDAINTAAKTQNNNVLALSQASLCSRISNATISIEVGQFWHVIGPNGAGKSSLLHIMAGTIKPDSGAVLYLDHELENMGFANLAKTRCFLHQQIASEFNIPITQILEFYAHMTRLPETLDTYLGINKYLDKPLTHLSGGQQQRFNIARCLCQVWPAIEQGKAFILLDEPVAQLDVKYQTAIMKCLTDLCTKGNTVVASCHDINLSLLYASHVAMLKQQQIIELGEAFAVLTRDKLSHVFDYQFTEIHNVQGTQKYFVGSSNKAI